MPNLSRTRWWDRQLEFEYPDCRLPYLDREKVQVQRGRMVFDMVYCADCGAPKALAPVEATTFAFFVCNECVAKKGPPAGCVEVEGPKVE